jgi:4-hydroxybenzoate polyprenyltransferase
MNMIRLLRPHQWIKNSFVLLGIIFSRQWDKPTVMCAGVAFLAFCAVASAVYVLNDILDIEADRLHPVKRHRSLVVGTVTIPQAWCLSGGLFAVAMALSLWVGRTAAALVVVYWLQNMAYSLRLKHVVILDVFIISAGFMVRILMGTIGLGIAPSHWLLLCGVMVTLFLGFAKRRSEMLVLNVDSKPDRATTRRWPVAYTPAMLDQLIAVSSVCTILSYSIYTVSPDTIARHGSDKLIYTVPFVVYGIFHYLYLVYHQSRGHDASRDLLTDIPLIVTVASWLGMTVWLLS